MADLAELPTATLIERWHNLNAAANAPLDSLHLDVEQVNMVEGMILDAQCETHEILACRPVRSSEDAHALIGVALEILKDGPRTEEAGERILLMVADYLKGDEGPEAQR